MVTIFYMYYCIFSNILVLIVQLDVLSANMVNTFYLLRYRKPLISRELEE